jgi:hypothetical protein
MNQICGLCAALLILGCVTNGASQPRNPPQPIGGSGGVDSTGGTGGGGGRASDSGAGGSSQPPTARDASVDSSDARTPLPDATAAEAHAADGPAVVPGACAGMFGGGAISEWVRYDERGKLVYKTLNAQGDRIMDFSSSGYMGGGVPLPNVPVAVTIGPSGGEDSDAIQSAIDTVSQRPLQNGFRGAVLLKPGAYRTTKTVTIAASGVVLRGSGTGADGTVIDLTTTSHVFLTIQGNSARRALGTKVMITDEYVPAGTRSFSVNDASEFKVGDAVLVGRPVTAAWVTFMGMDMLVRDGAPQSWRAVGSADNYERVITAIAGNQVTVDIPLPDSLDGQYVKPPGGSLQKFTYDGRLSQVGLESLRVIAPVRSAAQAGEPDHGGSQFVLMNNAIDSWIQDVVGHNVVEGIHIHGLSKRVTVERAAITHDPTDYITSSAPFDFSVGGSQVLVHRSSSMGGNKIFSYATQHAPGPNVVLDFHATGRAQLQPHQRWATGLLVDGADIMQTGTGTGAGICFLNRGTGGSGHGWSQGWGVAWNSTSPGILLQKPPGSMIWAIGCKGTPSAPIAAPGVGGPPLPSGIFESLNTPVAPNSLYLAQLCERLGPKAVANLGYK